MMASHSQKALSRAMVALAACALLALVALNRTATVRSVALLQAKQDVMKNYIAGAERQLTYLEKSLPDGKVAAQYPREENELKELLQHSEKGLAAIQKIQEKNAKKAATASALAQTVSSRKKHLEGLVKEAGSMMNNLRAQLPAADRKAFPKEAKELNQAFSSEVKSLHGIDKQLHGVKKSQTSALHSATQQRPSKPSAASGKSAMQKALDDAVQKDRQENKALSTQQDAASVLDVFNAAPKVSPKGHLVHHAKAEAEAEHARPTQLAEAEGALTSSGIRRWGTVYDPMMGKQNGARGQAQMYAPAQKEFSYYAQEANKFVNVHDPTKDGHEDNSNWWAEKSNQHDQWWAHDHSGRGY